MTTTNTTDNLVIVTDLIAKEIAELQGSDANQFAQIHSTSRGNNFAALILGPRYIKVAERWSDDNTTLHDEYYGIDKIVRLGNPDAHEIADFIEENRDMIAKIMVGADKAWTGSDYAPDWSDDAIDAIEALRSKVGPYRFTPVVAGDRDMADGWVDASANEIVAGLGRGVVATELLEKEIASIDLEWMDDDVRIVVDANDLREWITARVAKIQEAETN